MKRPTTSPPAARDRIARPARRLARFCGCTLTVLAAVWLASPVSPFMQAESTVAVAPPSQLRMPTPPPEEPEPMNGLLHFVSPVSAYETDCGY